MIEMPKAFVCGHPIEHSRSPIIHNFWLKRHNLPGSYDPVDFGPDRFELFLKNLGSYGWCGGNITIPHKEAAFTIVDKLDAAASAIGAVNTVWLEGGLLYGSNTDAFGFTANLDEQAPSWRNSEKAVVFGAGGASRAIVFALREAGIPKVFIVNRTTRRAEEIASRFGESVTAQTWSEAAELIKHSDLLINTTSLGMHGQQPFPLDLSGTKPNSIAADIVYVPLETPFLRLAKARGLKTSDGLGMLLHQAIPGFERWFGVKPRVDAELRQLVIDDLPKGSSA